MNSESISNLASELQEPSKMELPSDVELYRHLFAWIGLLHSLRVSELKECDTDIDHWRKVLLDAMQTAKSYQGSNSQLKAGFQTMLQSIPELMGFYPELVNDLTKA